MNNLDLRVLVSQTRRFGEGASARAEGKPRRAPTEFGYEIENSDNWRAGWDWMQDKIEAELSAVWTQVSDFRMPGEPELIVRKGALTEALYLQKDGSWAADLDAARRFTNAAWACQVADDYAKGDTYAVLPL